MARYGSWGAVAQVFDERRVDEHERRITLMEMLGKDGYEAARRTTINAHFTDPAIAQPIWETLQGLGFEGGRVLEPGSGMGTFIGLAPEGARMTGVELDPTTAELASHLYPQATIRNEPFQDTKAKNGSFDAAIGNVPFADIKPYDPVHNPGEFSLHNYFIAKSLNLVRPGGVAAFVTSAYTMDAQNRAARRAMYDRADLIGAVRLPNGAHERAAGTRVLTDILIFRVRFEGEQPQPDDWTATHRVDLRSKDGRDTESMRVNRYFLDNPNHVLGNLIYTSGVRGSLQVGVQDDAYTSLSLSERLRNNLHLVVESAQARGLTMTATSAAVEAPQGALDTTAATLEVPEPTVDEPGLVTASEAPASIRWDGHIEAVGNDFVQYIDGEPEPLPRVPKARDTRRELRALLELRDAGTTLLQTESRTRGDDPAVEAQRADLRGKWEAYVETYGPINRYTPSWRWTRPTDGTEPREYMVPTFPSAARLFRGDPFAPFVNALEKFDPETQTARPADLLQHRAVAQRQIPQGADNIRDALSVTLDATGTVDLEMIAQLRDTTPDEARTELGTLVYDDPATDTLVTTSEYLSGNVREKLAQAREAAQVDPDRYTANVTALEGVIPKDLGASEIQPQVGAVWIPAQDHEQFLYELLGAKEGTIQMETSGDGRWQVRQRGIGAMMSASVTWGTERRNAVDLFKAMAEQRSILVFDKNEDGSRVLNNTETAAANAKAEVLRERFQEWVWEDPERATRLTRAYNDTFNSLVLRDYTDAGKVLTFPGMAETFTPRDHQRAAVARMIHEPAVGLFHQVGAGKTAEMVIGSMELKRLGMVGKPAIVVPNHMLEQFSREYMQIYPRARLLAAGGKDLEKDKRRAFVAKIANNEWDTIIMTRGAFEALDLSPETKSRFIQDELSQMRASITDARAKEGSDLSVKEMEKKAERLSENLKKTLDRPSDPGISFEDTGIDYVCIDEAHDYKNLTTASNIQGASIAGADRADNLYAKMQYLRSQYGTRVGTFATGTPIANSVSEAYVMQKYLRPDLLENAGLRSFDSWAATFGKTVMSVEMAPEGNKFRTVQRFAQFQNVPELLRMMHTYADVKMADDLNLPTPDLRERADGKRAPEMETVEASDVTLEYIQELGQRADDVRRGLVSPYDDNMLQISTDGRKAALSPELVGLDDPAAGSGKIAMSAASIARIYHQTKDTEYPTDGGLMTPGALQIVFCDMRRAKDSGYDAYEDLRDRLVAGGVPAEKIQFMQDANSDRKKAQVFAEARNGDINVLIGSTQTMGTGTNVQRRGVALHHLDCPWRPADVEQREGRILRQGNENAEISIHRWATQKSFDAYMWQTVERKSKFIDQIMRGTLDVRTIEDIGKNTLNYAEMSAITADNPLLLEKTNLTSELQRLQQLERAHNAEQQNLRIRIPQMRDGLDTTRQNIEALRPIGARTQDTSGKDFTMEIRGVTYSERSKAAEAIVAWAKGTNFHAGFTEDRDLGQIATLAGQPIHATVPSTQSSGAAPSNPYVLLHVPGTLESHAVKMKASDYAVTDHRVITSLESRVAAIGRDVEKFERQIPDRERELHEAESNLGADFKHAHLLNLTRKQLADVEARMTARENGTDEGPEGPTLDDPGPDGPGGGGGGPKPPQRPTGPSHGADRAQPHHRITYRREGASVAYGRGD